MSSPLARFAHLWREADDAAARRMARDAFHATRGELVLINPKWLDSWVDAKQLQLLGAKVHGPLASSGKSRGVSDEAE